MLPEFISILARRETEDLYEATTAPIDPGLKPRGGWVGFCRGETCLEGIIVTVVIQACSPSPPLYQVIKFPETSGLYYLCDLAILV